MSFSSEVKEELCRHMSSARHCRIAELAVMTVYDGSWELGNTGIKELHIHAENPGIAKKCFTLWKKTFNINSNMEERASGKSGCVVSVPESEDLYKALEAMKLKESAEEGLWQDKTVHPLLVKNACCRRAFLRGAFLSAGSISNPANGYHLEYVCTGKAQAGQIQDILQSFGIEAKTVRRKKYFVVYLKEGSSIVDVLNIMEAHVALMSLENTRILKEMRNAINRRVNCEAANITKTVNASARQIEDIEFLQSVLGFDKLPENLREAAEKRLQYPEAPLKELGEYMIPPVGKSGVNHRLRKLSELAEEIRGKGGEL